MGLQCIAALIAIAIELVRIWHGRTIVELVRDPVAIGILRHDNGCRKDFLSLIIQLRDIDEGEQYVRGVPLMMGIGLFSQACHFRERRLHSEIDVAISRKADMEWIVVLCLAVFLTAIVLIVRDASRD
jgi:hypothetical protein